MRINKSEIAGALVALGKLVCRTSPVEVYRYIQIKGGKNVVSFRTQNTDETLTFTDCPDNDAPFQAIVNFDDFRNAIRSSRNKEVRIELEADKLAVDHIQIPLAKDTGREVTVPDDARMTMLPSGFVKMLAAPAGIIDRSDYRKILRGIHICKEGFVATNGKEMTQTYRSLTLPYRFRRLCLQRNLKRWERCASGKAVDGNYPNWRQVVPTANALSHEVKLDNEHAAQITAFLKAIPANPPNNQVDITQGTDGKSLMLKSDTGMCSSVAATFAAPWGEASLSVNRDMLVRAMQQGHRRIAFSDGNSPFIVTGGLGQYVAMPLYIHKQAQPKQQEETKVSEVKTSVVAAPVPPVVINHENEVAANPLDELSAAIDDFKARIRTMFDESAALSRKVKEVALAQKQKERDFVQAKRAIERIRMAI